MKLLQISYHFEYGEAIEAMLDRHGVQDYIRFSMVEGKDCDGKHFGSQVYPGSVSVVQAQVPPGKLEALLEELGRFRSRKAAHKHIQALVMPIEYRL